MNEIGIIRLRLKCRECFRVKSSNEAFLSSKITADWNETDDLYKIVSSVIPRPEFDAMISSFIKRGAIESESENLKKIEFNGGRDLRDYGTIKFDPVELRDAPELPENIKKEILFLYYYGKNINYYKVLNISELYNATDKKIAEKCGCYRKLMAGKNFEDIDMGGYSQKMAKVKEIIKAACKIEEEDIKKDYNTFLINVEKSLNPSTSKNDGRIETARNKAEKHFLIAMRFSHRKEFQSAYNEVLIALHLNPDNKNYIDLRNELTQKLREEKTSSLFNELEKNEFLLLDETKLEAIIDNILQLTEDSPLTHLKIAELALEKEMPEMAIQHAIQAVKKDPDLKSRVAKIVKKADMKKNEFNVEQTKSTKAYQITRDNVPRKN